MKFIIFATLLFIFSPFAAQAHGGVEKSVGNTTIYLTQTPLSPLVGEKVKMTFVFGKIGTTERLRNLDVELNLIDTFYDDATKDEIILTQQKKTDENGAFEFEYTFNKENFFDVDLKFKDPATQEDQDIGFLVEPRSIKGIRFDIIELLLTAGVGIILGMGIKQYLNRKNKYEMENSSKL